MIDNIFEKIKQAFSSRKISQDDAGHYQRELEELVVMQELKQTRGWVLLDKRIKEELRNTILQEVADNPKIQTLLRILEQVEVKRREQLLTEAINEIIE